MIYLAENEVGFDSNAIGFPSISGCQAIVYCTKVGLFGYHSYGGVQAHQWPGRAQMFNNFIRSPGRANVVGTRLYGATFAQGAHSRGYGANYKTGWTNELTAYASAIGFNGKIRGYDLSKTVTTTSAYVEFRKNGDKCEIWVRSWVASEETQGACPGGADIAYIKPGATPTLESRIGKQIVTGIGGTASGYVHSTRLRG